LDLEQGVGLGKITERLAKEVETCDNLCGSDKRVVICWG